MKEEKNLVVGDEIELTDDQLENVVGGIDFHNGQNRFESIKIGVACTSCGSANVVKSYKKEALRPINAKTVALNGKNVLSNN